MTLIPFTVSARTAQLIGQQNFSSAEGAVIELVKNCYDADSKIAIILFDNDDVDESNHALYIIDNGEGMTETIIRDNWMMIGTDNKENNYATNTGRVKTGAKGIGRFALDRLGETAEMYTLPKKSDVGNYWRVNWNDFKQKGISISQVNAVLEPLSNDEFNTVLTKISTYSSRLLEYIIHNEMEFNSGTIIKISNLKEQWSIDEITKLYENLEILIPPKEQPTFDIALYAKNTPSDYGPLTGIYFDDFDYKLSAKYLDNDDNKTINITIERNELDLNKIEKSYMEVFSIPIMRNPPYNYDFFKSEKFEYGISLNELVKGQSEIDQNKLLDKIGKFDFSFYFLKNSKSDDKNESDVKKYPYKDFNSSSRRAWLKKFGGIKIFRDDFRVRPYGEYGEDWLKLGERQGQSPQGAGQRIGAYRIRPNQISGTVNISRLTNLSFQDKSGREGIQENEVFDLFKSILKGIIAQFERDRNIIMNSFSERYKRVNLEEEARIKAEQEAGRILAAEAKRKEEEEKNSSNSSNTSEQNTSDTATKAEIVLAEGFQIQKNEIEEKDNEIRLLRSLSGTGLIVASFAHELRSLRTLLVSRTDELKTVLEGHLNLKEIKKLPPEDNPYVMLNHMREQDVQIKHWLDYSLSALKKDKRTRKDLDITEYFQSFKNNWENALKRRIVNLKINNKLSSPINIRAFAIDFDTLFNNMLINSLDSFKRRKDNHVRDVEITYECEDQTLKIYFADSGAGLSKDFLKEPTEIFLPFETSKVDKRGNKIGTGIGMYLAKAIIDDYKGNIEILKVKNGFKLGIYLPLRKDNYE